MVGWIWMAKHYYLWTHKNKKLDSVLTQYDIDYLFIHTSRVESQYFISRLFVFTAIFLFSVCLWRVMFQTAVYNQSKFFCVWWFRVLYNAKKEVCCSFPWEQTQNYWKVKILLHLLKILKWVKLQYTKWRKMRLYYLLFSLQLFS